jgi:broad specificity phosphatase PhoE
VKLNNHYYLLRHGQALSNVTHRASCWPETFENHLTPEGRSQIEEAAVKIKEKKIDIIIASDITRTKETAQIISDVVGIPIAFDERLREIGFGSMNGRLITEFTAQFASTQERIRGGVNGSEPYQAVSDRAWDFLEDMERRYHGKNIVVVTHECLVWLMRLKYEGASIEDSLDVLGERIKNGEFYELS